MSNRYPQLDAIHETFVAALAKDPAPKTSVALFWSEAISMLRDPAAPDARTRGNAFLQYFDGPTIAGEVPGQAFEKGALPNPTCASLIKQGAASMDGPRAITFRYERDGDTWSGGYSIETSSEYRELVLGRAEIDRKIGDALRAMLVDGVAYASIMYGVHGWKTWDAKLKLKREKVEFLELPEPLATLWADFVSFMKAHGARHIYYADLTVSDPSEPFGEGRGIQVRYSR